MNFIKNALKYVGYFFLYLFLIGVVLSIFGKSCGSKPTDTPPVVVAPTPSAAPSAVATPGVAVAEPTKVPDVSYWQYSQDQDEMTNKIERYASLGAYNVLNFDYPYKDGGYSTLGIKNTGRGNQVYLKIAKGQFMSSYNNSVRLKFDESPAITMDYSGTADGDPTVIFLDNPNFVINKLKKAEELKVEATFYNQGSQIMKFYVKNFIWEK